MDAGSGLVRGRVGDQEGGTEHTGVYPRTTYDVFIKTLKKEMTTVKDLGGHRPTPEKRATSTEARLRLK